MMSEIADYLERFRRGAELLAVATTGAAGPELDFKPEGKWSVRQLVCHLADTEAVGVMRFRQLIAEENPVMVPWDQEAWAAKLDYDKQKISHALEIFRVLRSANYDLLKDQPEAAYQRAGTHELRGRLTLLDMLRIYAEHVENHVRQIHTVRAAYKEHKKAAAGPSAS
jgi:hypothetical protein